MGVFSAFSAQRPTSSALFTAATPTAIWIPRSGRNMTGRLFLELGPRKRFLSRRLSLFVSATVCFIIDPCLVHSAAAASGNRRLCRATLNSSTEQSRSPENHVSGSVYRASKVRLIVCVSKPCTPLDVGHIGGLTGGRERSCAEWGGLGRTGAVWVGTAAGR